MSTTNKSQAYIVAEVAALDVPLPFDGYLKPVETWAVPGIPEYDEEGIRKSVDEWADMGVPEYYTLNEIDGTSILGHKIKIKKSLDGAYFIYSDSNFSYRKKHFATLEQMKTTLGLTMEILTPTEEVFAELNGTAGADQIALAGWEDVSIT